MSDYSDPLKVAFMQTSALGGVDLANTPGNMERAKTFVDGMTAHIESLKAELSEARAALIAVSDAALGLEDDPSYLWSEDDEHGYNVFCQYLGKIDQDEQGYNADGSPKPAYHTSVAAAALSAIEDHRAAMKRMQDFLSTHASTIQKARDAS